MAWLAARDCRRRPRPGTACAVLLSLLFLLLTSDRLHNHSGVEQGLTVATHGPAAMGLASSSRPAVPGRSLPCLACLHLRTFYLGPVAIIPEKFSLPEVAGSGLPGPTPPPAPVIRSADVRAPPVC